MSTRRKNSTRCVVAPRVPRALATGEEQDFRGSDGVHDGAILNPSGRSVPDPASYNSRVKLKFKQLLNVGTWNVRTLLEMGKLHLLIDELDYLKCGITGLAEVRWAGKGSFRTRKEYSVFYSGNEKGGQKGVALILNPKMANAVLGYNPMNDRMISLRLNCKPFNITIIQVYAPTSDATQDEREAFYANLQQLKDSVPSQDVLIICGDFNAKVGDKTIEPSVMGDNGLGEANEPGKRLIEFCCENNLVITNTLFKNHSRKKYTWISPDGITKNQIDYILVSRRWRTNIKNCHTYPGADCGSDHQLLMSKMRIKVKKLAKEPPPLRYDLARIPVSYSLEVNNKFEQLLGFEEEATPNELWENIKQVIKDTANKCIPKKRKVKSQPWISDETLHICKNRREAKTCHGINSEEYKTLHRKVRTSCRKDKKEYYSKICGELTEQARHGNSRGLFQQVKRLTKKFTPRMESIKDGNGSLLTEAEDVKNRWREYVMNLYKNPEDSDNNQTSTTSPDDYEREPAPLISEVKNSIRYIRNNKAPGFDDIPIELIKHAGSNCEKLIHKLITEIWNTGEWPDDWCKACYLPIPKKGDLQNCANYRTIALISHASKILLHIILGRLKGTMNSEMAQEQAGFRPGRGTRDQSFNLRVIMQKMYEANRGLYLCFIDYKKAFDCINYELLWKTMIKMGFPVHIVSLIRSLYKNQASRVMTNNGPTDWFKNERGVRQGCVLSPNLFNIETEEIIRQATTEFDGVSVGGRHISNLRYADDTVLLAESEEKLQSLLDAVEDRSAEHGLLLNASKTKVMYSGKETEGVTILTRAGEELEQVSEFTYLGSCIDDDNSCENDIRKRLAMGRTSMIKLVKIWADHGVPKQLKYRLVKALIWPIACFGSEAWTIKAADEKRIQAFEMFCIRRLLRVSYMDRRTNSWCLNKLETERLLLETIKQRKLKYFGHVQRKDGSLEKDILEGKIEGKRSKGRQKMSWCDNIKMWTGLKMSAAREAAKDRVAWREISNARGRVR